MSTDKPKRGKKTHSPIIPIFFGGALVLGCCCLPAVGGGVYWLFFTGSKDKVLTLPAEVNDKWSKDDPTRKQPNGAAAIKAPYKAYRVELKANGEYTIRLNSPDPKAGHPYLLLEDMGGKVVATDADNGLGTHSRIVFSPTSDGVYRIICMTLTPGSTSDFTLKVTQTGTWESPEKIILGKWQMDQNETMKTVPPEDKLMVDKIVRTLPKAYEFRADKTLLIYDRGSTTVSPGKWSLESGVRPPTIVFTFADTGGQIKLLVTVVNNDTLRILEKDDARNQQIVEVPSPLYKRLQ
jgi:hypothetical protein